MQLRRIVRRYFKIEGNGNSMVIFTKYPAGYLDRIGGKFRCYNSDITSHIRRSAVLITAIIEFGPRDKPRIREKIGRGYSLG